MQSFFRRIAAQWQRRPVTCSLVFTGSVFAMVVIALILIAVIPKPVTLSYAGDTCARQLTLFPSVTQPVGDAVLDVTFEDAWSIASWPVVSSKTCVQPTQAVQSGEQMVRYGLFGWAFPSKALAVTIPSLPVAQVASLANTAISSTRPLTIPLSAPDTTHAYRLESNGQKAPCEFTNGNLECQLTPLRLSHGTTYELTLHRSFNNESATSLSSFVVQTLQPLQVTAQSIPNSQTVYDKPMSIRLSLDAIIVAAEVRLMAKVGDTETRVSTDTRTEGQDVIVNIHQPLSRETAFVLTLTSADGQNGSSLAAPFAIPFTTSGGPKVTGISIGQNNAPQTGQAVITFDQPLHKDVDVTKFISLQGVPGLVRRLNDTQVVVTLQNAPLCAPFTITVQKGMKSSSNDEAAKDNWVHNSRIVCGTSAAIGASVRGRPIIAHYFGNGSKTILFTGGIHGEEQSTVTTMNAWVEHLKANAHRIPAGTRVVVVPNTNPDGIAARTRYNANDVNIARNFPAANWSASIETARGTLPAGGGTTPGSEPETRALMALTNQLRPRLEVSVHSQGRLVGANHVGDSLAIGNVYASTVGYRTMFYNAEEVMGYTITGEYEIWMGEAMGIPAILIELPSHSGNYLSSQLDALWKMVNV